MMIMIGLMIMTINLAT